MKNKDWENLRDRIEELREYRNSRVQKKEVPDPSVERLLNVLGIGIIGLPVITGLGLWATSLMSNLSSRAEVASPFEFHYQCMANKYSEGRHTVITVRKVDARYNPSSISVLIDPKSGNISRFGKNGMKMPEPLVLDFEINKPAGPIVVEIREGEVGGVEDYQTYKLTTRGTFLQNCG